MKKKLLFWALLLAAFLFTGAERALAASDAEATMIRILSDIASKLGTGSTTTTTIAKGAPSIANGQVTSSTVAGTAVAARATRRSVVIKNTDATITVYLGIATVTSGNGLPLKAGESVSIDSTALIQVIAASGSPVIAYMETYD